MKEVFQNIEESSKKLWETIDLRRIILEERKKRKKKFWLLDGPPYVNDIPHVGHARNLIIKDFMLKYHFLKGYAVYFKPGFDTHGLPIEVKVEKKLGIKNKREIEEKIGVDKFIEECWKFAEGNEERWMEFYRKIGHWYAFEKPYLTFTKEYIETAWWLFKQIWENGLVYSEEKPVWWCPRCQTALAGYEVVDEYADIEDPSIYILFPVVGEENTYLLVWTTTPWTLNANVAIAAHPEETYVKVKLSDGRKLILAEKRLCLLEEWGYGYEILEKFPGKKLEGLKYKGVIDNEIQRKLDEDEKGHRVIMSIPILKGYIGAKVLTKKEAEETEATYEHFVNVEEGTGLVHVAPGHGKEDFLIAKHYGLPIYSPVDEEGRLTIEPFKGEYVRDANEKIIKYLEERGLLFRAEKIVHRYPLCWRCKTPLIYRTSRDFFINIQKIKEKMLEAIEKIKFMPEFARERMKNWVKNEEDWDISRKRYWGIPIPVWVCKKCGNVVVIGSVKELMEKATNLEKEPEDLHKNVVDKIKLRCDKCGGEMERVPDVFDVWYDSGCATFASWHYPFENKEEFERIWRVDFIVEGQDQIRGWFDRLLEVSIAARGDYPYDSVMMLGWIVDEKGQKMSKRLGNVVWAIDAYNELTADILRFYELWKSAPWETIGFSLKEAKKEVTRIFNIYLNVTRYIIERGREVGFKLNGLRIEDRWLISKFNSFVEKLEKAVSTGKLNEYVRALEDFGVNVVSRVYIKLVRDRVQIEKDSTPIALLADIWKKFLVCLAPVAPHLAEYLYQKLVSEIGKGKKTIFLEKFPEVEKDKIDKDLERDFEILLRIFDYIALIRNKLGIKLRYPLEFIILPEKVEEQVKYKKEFKEVLKKLANVKKIFFYTEGIGIIDKEKEYVRELVPEGWLYVSKKYDVKEAFVAEFCRLVQELRKRRGFKVFEKLDLYVECSDEIRKILEEKRDLIERRVNCTLKFGKGEEEIVVENKKIKVRFEKKKVGFLENILEKIKKIFRK